jgi:hypothetical protein
MRFFILFVASSMNFVMAGMILLAALWPDAMESTALEFWFRMSLASIAGGILAFPVNAWLVHKKLKHERMTLPGADGAPASKMGHTATESTVGMGHSHHDMSKTGHEMSKMDHGMSKTDHDMSAMNHGGHEMGSISFLTQCV